MTRTYHFFTPLLVAAALAGCAASQAPVQEARSAPPEVDADALIAAHDAAWNDQDTEAMLALFTHDATVKTPSGELVEGTAELRTLFDTPNPTDETTSVTRVTRLERLGPELVLLDAEQVLGGDGVTQLGTSRARLVAVLRYEDGAWRIAAARPQVLYGPSPGAASADESALAHVGD